MPLRAVIFDFGGVLIRTEDYGPREALARRYGVSREYLEYLVLTGPEGIRAQLGEIHPRDLWRYVARELGIPHPDPDALERQFWGGDRFNTEIIEFARSLRGRYKVALLSNAWITLRDFLKTTPVADLFDVQVISAEVGLMKPDPRIYARVLGELGVLPHEAVFIDDMPENVEGARRVGLHALRFTDNPTLFRDLKRLGFSTEGQAIKSNTKH